MRSTLFLAALTMSTSAYAAICPLTDEDLAPGVTTASGDTTGLGDDWQACGDAAEDYAYEFVAPADGIYTFDLDTSSYDTYISIVDTTDCVTEIDCDDDGSTGTTSLGEATLLAGESVVVIIGGFGTATGAYNLNITAAPLPTVETVCDDGIDDDLDTFVDCDDSDCAADQACIPSVCTVDTDLGSATGFAAFSGNTCGAGDDRFNTTCAGGQFGEDLLLTWTAPADGSYTFSTVSANTDYDTALSIWDSSCLEAACNDDYTTPGGTAAPGFQSGLNVTVSAGDVVQLSVDGYTGFGGPPGDCGNFELNILEDATCLDDDLDGVCDGATPGNFAITATPPIANQPMTFSATGAVPGSTVFFIVGPTVNGPTICHPTYTTECTDINPVNVLGTRTADANGDASLTVTVPPTVSLLNNVFFTGFYLDAAGGTGMTTGDQSIPVP